MFLLLSKVIRNISKPGSWQNRRTCVDTCGSPITGRTCADDRQKRALGTQLRASSGNHCSQNAGHDSSRGTPPEPLLAEVAWLIAQGSCAAAVELLRNVRNAWKQSIDDLRKRPGPACFRAVMQGLARSRAPRALFGQLIEEMCLAGLPQDALTEGCCVRYLCRAPDANIDDALCAYESMIGLGITPDLRTVECLAEACLRAHRAAAAQELITQLGDFKLRPTPTLYALLITACGMTGAVARGFVALEQMRHAMQDDFAAMRLGYTSAIHMCAQNHQVERAMALFTEGRCAGYPLSGAVLATLLAAAVQTGDADLALQVAAKARHELDACSAVFRVCKLLETRPGSDMLLLRVQSVLAGKLKVPPMVPSRSKSPEEHASLPGFASVEPERAGTRVHDPRFPARAMREPVLDQAASSVCKATRKAVCAFRQLGIAFARCT